MKALSPSTSTAHGVYLHRWLGLLYSTQVYLALPVLTRPVIGAFL